MNRVQYIEKIKAEAVEKANKVGFVPVVGFILDSEAPDSDFSYNIVLCDGENDSWDIANDLMDRYDNEYPRPYIIYRDGEAFASWSSEDILNEHMLIGIF